MLIRVEVTPNPAARRFLLQRPLPLREPMAFSRSNERRPPLVERLLKIQGVTDLLFASEFISVSSDVTAEPWPDLQFAIVGEIIEGLAHGEDAELDRWIEQQLSSGDPVEQQIADLLRSRIAPRVARDGGSITLLSYGDGVATVEMRGACGGCPSAMMTLKRTVETTLKHYIPELQRVEASLQADSKKPFWKSMLEARGARFRNG
ncbi:MAG TPA: NifU family protein [Sphingomicrobium sp.]|nr:NifU family protein [Sphingomicrobium sp.]